MGVGVYRDVGKHMLATRKEGDSRGKIINIASLASYQGGATIPAYAAAKHGILGLTKGLSNDWAGKGINVNASTFILLLPFIFPPKLIEN